MDSLLNARLVGHICFFTIISWVETEKPSTSYYRKPYAKLKVLQVSEVSCMLVKHNSKEIAQQEWANKVCCSQNPRF